MGDPKLEGKDMSILTRFLAVCFTFFISNSLFAAKFLADGSVSSHSAACDIVGTHLYGSDYATFSSSYLIPFQHLAVCTATFELPPGSANIPPHPDVDYAIPYYPDPAPPNTSNPNRGPGNACTNNPVNIATGSKFFVTTDYQNAAAPLLNITRTYDSSDGRWIFNLAADLFIENSNVYVRTEFGATAEFAHGPDGWISINSNRYSLSQFDDHWEFKDKNITTHFDLNGR